MEFNPCEEADMQPFGDGSYEMVLHQEPRFSKRRSLYHNFPDVKEWHTGDLFVPHPTKKGLWRFQSRIDDLIILSSSHKLRPVEMETAIQGDPLLFGALIVGQGKPEPLLIVEPKPDAFDGNDSEAFIEQIWPTVQEANKLGASYAKIDRSRIIVANPQRPFIRAPKGSIVRKLTTKLYAEDIEAVYSGSRTSRGQGGSAGGLQGFLMSGIKEFVRQNIERLLPGVPISDTDNIFLKGLDSLTCASLTRSVQKGVESTFPSGSSSAITSRLVYINPSIEKLSDAILKLITRVELREMNTGKDVEGMKHTVEELTKGLPDIRRETSVQEASEQHITDVSSEEELAVKPYRADMMVADSFTTSISRTNVALLGPRGTLGPNVLNALLADPRVAKVYCLNRGENGRDQMRAIVKSRGLSINVDDPRLAFMSTDIMKPRLGLSQIDYDELRNNAQVLIHNAWKVDFNWAFESYLDSYLGGVRELIDLSLDSRHKMRIAFVSSVASAAEWKTVYPNTAVEERPFESYDVASSLGYGQSKHVSERVLAAASSSVPVTILRMGQIAGPTRSNGGKWPAHEWVPALIHLSRDIQAVPRDLPPIDWIPVDMAGEAVSQITLNDASRDQETLGIYNVVNRQLTPWSKFASIIRCRIGKVSEMVGLSEWVKRVTQAAEAKQLSADTTQLAVQLLPWFEEMIKPSKDTQSANVTFDTGKAQGASDRMRQLKAVDEGLMNLWMDQWGI
jgi:thioester reductase-like protein